VRLKMDNFDIKAFAKMLDAAIASDNPAVKKALKNFMMIAAIAETEKDISGPLETLLDRMDALEQELRTMKMNPYPVYPGGYPTVPSYPRSPGYPGTGTHRGPTYSTSTLATSSTLSEDEIVELLLDLKADSYWSAKEVSSLEQAFKDFNAK